VHASWAVLAAAVMVMVMVLLVAEVSFPSVAVSV
jgi:hypothetical protein